MAPPRNTGPPADAPAPRLRAMDQRSLLKVSMKSWSEEMKAGRDRAYANKGLHHKKKLRSQLPLFPQLSN